MRLSVHDPNHAALRKALRTAIVMPALFAICSVAFESSQVALFAAFGSFAMLSFADFGGPRRRRLGAYAALTLGGAVLITLATVVSNVVWLSTVAMATVGFTIAFGSVIGGYVAAGSAAATLSFVLAVAVPAEAGDIPARLVGWGLAGAAAGAAALLLWPRYERTELARRLTAAIAAVGDLVEAGLAPVDRAAVERRREEALQAVQTAARVYRTMLYRPAGPTAHDQAIAYLVDELPWLRAFADDLAVARLAGGELSAEEEHLAAASLRTLRTAAEELEKLRPAPAETGLESAREEYLAGVRGTLQRRFAARATPDEIAASIRRMFRLRLLSYLAISVAGNASILSGREPGPIDYEIPPLMPSGSLSAFARRLVLVVRGHLRLDSIWFRAGLRAALALGLAVLVAKLGELQHAFWVVLGTLSVLKSNAISTSYAAWQALVGTLVGFGLSTALILGVHDSRTALWILFPFCVFLAVYTPTAVHVAVGQAMFTVLVVVLFNLIEPEGWRTGLVRVEDILIGAATAVVVGILLWPRGARAQLRQALAGLYESGGAYVRATLDAALGHPPGDVPSAARAARGAGLRAAEALSTYLNERGPKRMPIDVWTKLLATGRQLRLVGDAVVVRTGAYGEVRGFEPVVETLETEAAELERQVDDVADAVAEVNRETRLPQAAPDQAEAIVRLSVASCNGVPSAEDVDQMLGLAWTAEWIAHVRARLATLDDPLAKIRGVEAGAWWR